MIKLLVVEDQQILLDSISSALDNSPGFKVVGKLTDSKEIMPFLKTNPVDLILTDICTGDKTNSLDYIFEIKIHYPNIKIVVMTGLPEISFINRAKEAGADSFIYKNIAMDYLVFSLRGTLDGYNIYPDSDTNYDRFYHLNAQEIRIVRFFCQGYNRKEIAEQMYLSENSIKSYISIILSKTNFPSMTKLAIYAIKNNFIVPN